MVDLQELIARGRMIFNGADKRFEVFELVNGILPTKQIATKAHRSHSAVDQDLEKLKDMELIQEKKDGKGNIVKKAGSVVYEKNPIIKHIPLAYFEGVADTSKLVKKSVQKQTRISKPGSIHVPSEKETLDISRLGEDQSYEFKGPGVSTDKLTREICGFVHTKGGGIIFYGIDDNGTIIGADVKRQVFDQKVHNSVRNTVSPTPSIEIKERSVMGSSVLMIIVRPWDRATLYQNTLDGRYYIRRGTNIFALKPDEIKKLNQGIPVV